MKKAKAKNGKTTAAGVLGAIARHRKDVLRFGVRRLGLFGSAARGEARKGSDLDFLVEFEQDTFDNYMGLKIYLEDLFHKKIDLVMTDTLKERLRPAILQEVRYAQGL